MEEVGAKKDVVIHHLQSHVPAELRRQALSIWVIWDKEYQAALTITNNITEQ